MRSLIVIAAIFAIPLYSLGKKVSGTIIAKGESRNVMFDINIPLLGTEPNFERIQYKVKYYDENGKKRTLRPDDADEIWFDYDGGEVHMISCVNTLGGGNIFSMSEKIFLKVEIDGPLRLYRYYFRTTTPGVGGAPPMTRMEDNFVFQKRNGPLKQPRWLGWKKDMLEYFSDCPGLRDRIENKDLNRREIEAIVMYYNSNCGKK